MNKPARIVLISLCAVIFGICFGCFKTELKKLRIEGVTLEVYNITGEYLSDDDTCSCDELEVYASLDDENVAQIILPSLINEAYAFEYERYFDFTNEITDISIYLLNRQNDSIDITDNCTYYYEDCPLSGVDDLIESCNAEMVYYKTNTVKWPSIDFSFTIDDCYADSVEEQTVVMHLETDDGVSRDTSDYITITE